MREITLEVVTEISENVHLKELFHAKNNSEEYSTEDEFIEYVMQKCKNVLEATVWEHPGVSYDCDYHSTIINLAKDGSVEEAETTDEIGDEEYEADGETQEVGDEGQVTDDEEDEVDNEEQENDNKVQIDEENDI